MINRRELYSNFVQYGGTCILASYSIASNYYTGIPVLNFFKDFAEHFHSGIRGEDLFDYFKKHPLTPHDRIEAVKLFSTLSELNKYETVYDYYFHEEISSGRASGGLTLLKELHDTSEQGSFEVSRKAFSLSYVEHIECVSASVEESLDREESLVLAAFQGDNKDSRHICVVGHDNIGPYMIETRPGKENGAVPIPGLLSLEDVDDALLTIPVQKKR